MICNPSLKTMPVPACIGQLTVGKISSFNESIMVHLYDLTTGRHEVYQETSGADGSIVVDLSDKEFFASHTYEAWATKSNSQAKETITVGTESKEVIGITFSDCLENGEVFELPAATLEVA